MLTFCQIKIHHIFKSNLEAISSNCILSLQYTVTFLAYWFISFHFQATIMIVVYRINYFNSLQCFLWVCVCLSVCMCVCVCVCVHACVHVCLAICLSVCASVCACMRMCMCIHACVYVIIMIDDILWYKISWYTV